MPLFFSSVGKKIKQSKSYSFCGNFFTSNVFHERLSRPNSLFKDMNILKLHEKVAVNICLLTLTDPGISESCIEIKMTLNFYFRISLWCPERFYEGLLGLCKTF